jgi:hypothetical protein
LNGIEIDEGEGISNLIKENGEREEEGKDKADWESHFHEALVEREERRRKEKEDFEEREKERKSNKWNQRFAAFQFSLTHYQIRICSICRERKSTATLLRNISMNVNLS